MQQPSLQAGRSVVGQRCQPAAQARAAVARHPHAPALDATIQLAAPAVLQVEGVERVPGGSHSPAMVAPSVPVRQRPDSDTATGQDDDLCARTDMQSRLVRAMHSLELWGGEAPGH